MKNFRKNAPKPAAPPPGPPGKVIIRAKLMKGLNGLGCTIAEDGRITHIDPNGIVAQRDELKVGDRIVEVDGLPTWGREISAFIGSGSSWTVGVEREASMQSGPVDYTQRLEEEAMRRREEQRRRDAQAYAQRQAEARSRPPPQAQAQPTAQGQAHSQPPGGGGADTSGAVADYFAIFEAQGFERSQIQAALEAHNHDTNRAADWLLSGGHDRKEPPAGKALPRAPPAPPKEDLMGGGGGGGGGGGNNPPSEPVTGSEGLSGGAIAGIVIAVVVVTGAIGVGAYFLYKRCIPGDKPGPTVVVE